MSDLFNNPWGAAPQQDTKPQPANSWFAFDTPAATQPQDSSNQDKPEDKEEEKDNDESFDSFETPDPTQQNEGGQPVPQNGAHLDDSFDDFEDSKPSELAKKSTTNEPSVELDKQAYTKSQEELSPQKEKDNSFDSFNEPEGSPVEGKMASDSKQTASSSQGKSQSVKIQKQEPVEDEQKDDSFDDFEAADTIEPAEQVKPDNHDPVL